MDALELSDEEGRGKLRYAAGRGKHPMIRRLPNGVTHIAFNAMYNEVNKIASLRKTQGTEPSKYLEEKKSNMRFPK